MIHFQKSAGPTATLIGRVLLFFDKTHQDMTGIQILCQSEDRKSFPGSVPVLWGVQLS